MKTKENKWLFLLMIGIAMTLGGYILQNVYGSSNVKATPYHVKGYTLLKGEEIPIDTVLFRYATYLRVQDDVAVIFDLHNQDYFCHVFTYPDFKYISSFGKRGEGPDETLIADNVRWAGKGEMWLLDNAKNRITRYSGIGKDMLPKLEEHVKLEKKLFRTFDFDVYNSQKALVPDCSGEKRFCWVDLSTGKILYKWMDIPVTNKKRYRQNPQAAAVGWRSFMAFTPDRKQLVCVNQFANRLDVYNLQDGKMATWLGDGLHEPEYMISSGGYSIPAGSICHYDVQVTEHYVYSVFDGRSFKEITGGNEQYKQGGQIFRVHTLDGKLVNEFMLDRPITGIYVDESSGILYGLDVNADEQIVSFPSLRHYLEQ